MKREMMMFGLAPRRLSAYRVQTLLVFAAMGIVAGSLSTSSVFAATETPPVTPKTSISSSRPTSMPNTLGAASAVQTTQPKSVNRQISATVDSLASHPLNAPHELKSLPNACSPDSAWVCYDYQHKRSVVPFTKSMMPDMPGMKREGITLKRDKLAFNYSF